MDVFFSDYFGVAPEAVEEYGAFDSANEDYTPSFRVREPGPSSFPVAIRPCEIPIE